MIEICIITVLYNHKKDDVYAWLQTLIQNFYYTKLYKFKIILVNNGSEEYIFNAYEYDNINIKGLSKYELIYHINDTNIGYCGGNNIGLKYISEDTKFVFIINPDMYINNSLVIDWMYSLSLQNNAITGSYRDGKSWLTYPAMFPTDKQYDPDKLPLAYNFNPKEKWPDQNWKSLPFIDGSLMCIPIDVYKLRFDEEFMPGYYGETAFQFKSFIELGTKLINVPISKFIDHRCKSDEQYGRTEKADWTEAARKLFYKKYVLPNYDKFLSILV